MNDLISRQAAIDVMLMAIDDDWEPDYATERMNELPSADIDLSDYSDRLWRKAYEQGKAVSKDALDEAYAHGYTAAEADFHKKNQWIPVSERLPEIDMTFPHSERYLVQYEDGDMDVASLSNVNRFWTDHVTEPHWNCVQFQTVTAWMPLPECYRGDGNDAEKTDKQN